MISQWKDYWLFYLVLLLLFATFLVFYWDWQSSHRPLTFAMLDVGQGDAIFIESPTGTQMLVDAGPDSSVLRELPKLMPFWDRSLDVVVMTHPDQDHVGGFVDIFKSYKVHTVFEPGVFSNTATYKSLEDTIKDKNIPNVLARAGMQVNLGGGAYVEFLFPDRSVVDWETNNASVVARLVYGDSSFMLTGDATKYTEGIILSTKTPEQLRSTVLKVGHHGSDTSSSAEFIRAVAPRYALISDGRNNKYGHPKESVLDTLGQFGAQILRTDQSGTVVFKCDRMSECKTNKSKN